MALSHAQPIHVGTTLNVQAVEDELTALWTANANDKDDEGAIVRARVLNLLVYVTDEETLKRTDETVFDVAAVHPCRVILMLEQKEKAAKDIEAFVSSRCHLGGSGKRHLCIEQVTMRASGNFADELPSAALPLLVPDLPSFLWWRGGFDFDDPVFKTLSRAVERIVIDSAAMNENELLNLTKVFNQKGVGAISDLNWARLTEWRSIIASLFDSPEHRVLLNHITNIEISYSNTARAFLITGWLASRLGWEMFRKEKNKFIFNKGSENISVVLVPNGLSSIKLMTKDGTAFFVSLDKAISYFEMSVTSNEDKTSNALACRKEDDTSLLTNELNLLYRDRIYEKTLLAVFLGMRDEG
jgi:glucose-6-phosphate dehydrogenase assembly protein OpcA